MEGECLRQDGPPGVKESCVAFERYDLERMTSRDVVGALLELHFTGSYFFSSCVSLELGDQDVVVKLTCVEGYFILGFRELSLCGVYVSGRSAIGLVNFEQLRGRLVERGNALVGRESALTEEELLPRDGPGGRGVTE